MAKNTQNKSSSLKYSNQVKDIYVDKLSKFSIGTMVSKLEFTVIREIENTNEVEVNLIVNIPTGNLIGAINQMQAQTSNLKVRKDLVAELKNYINFLESSENSEEE